MAETKLNKVQTGPTSYIYLNDEDLKAYEAAKAVDEARARGEVTLIVTPGALSAEAAALGSEPNGAPLNSLAEPQLEPTATAETTVALPGAKSKPAKSPAKGAE